MSEKNILIENLKLNLRDLEDNLLITNKELEQIQDEKALLEKKTKIEEESLKKRIVMHEEFAK